ncbi:MAG: 4-hydroxy-tetrahydrodipicolinate synthase [Hydrogenophilus sp.]|nr:4-hydroxy-tetrahydrodipicolinate synthase [Hydrogenophilus sp.]
MMRSFGGEGSMFSVTGSLVAIVTPMHEDGSVDWEGLRALIDWHVQEGSDGLVVVGTTGESPTLSFEEHVRVIEVAVSYAAGRIPVVAGTGANSTAEAIFLAKEAKQVGADAHLSVVPYYNKPTQEGLRRHFLAIADAVDLPMILYNVPGRTVADLSNEVVAELARHPNVVGIKDATGDMARAFDLFGRVPSDFLCYSGDDATALPFMMLGGKGVISVTANVTPRLMHEMCAAALAGDGARAVAIHRMLFGLHRELFCEPNPIPVKWALRAMGRIEGGIRLPLTPLSEERQERVRAALAQAGVPLREGIERRAMGSDG